MCLCVLAVPDVLLAAKSDHTHRTRKTTRRGVPMVKDNLDVVGIVLILVDEQQRPIAIRTVHSIGGDQGVPCAVLDSAVHAKEMMHAAAVRDPLLIDHLADIIFGCVPGDVEIAVADEIAPGSIAMATLVWRLGLDRRMVIRRAAIQEE